MLSRLHFKITGLTNVRHTYTRSLVLGAFWGRRSDGVAVSLRVNVHTVPNVVGLSPVLHTAVTHTA